MQVAVIGNAGEPADTLVARFSELGFGQIQVMQLGDRGLGGPARLSERPGVDLAGALEGLAAPERTLVVTGPADPVRAEDSAWFAGAVMTAPDGPLAKPLLAWLSTRMGTVAAASLLAGPLDTVAADRAAQRHLELTKPPGSLGRLESLGVQLSGISGQVPPPRTYPATVTIFAADHGVHAQGVSPWPQEVTRQMVANFLEQGAAINVLAHQVNAEVLVVDVGVAGELPSAQGLLNRKVANGTRDLAVGPAMSSDEMRQALDVGAEVAGGLVAQGVRCLLTGDMGIANTTPSTALIVALTGRRAGDITGPGAGLPTTEVPRKATVIAEAAARARSAHGDDPLGILAEVGGLEHAALVGFILGGVALGVPIVVDGLIAASALLVASRLVPGVEQSAIAGHRSVEPGSAAVLEALELEPVVDLDLRLGEGTGAAVALPIVDAAGRVLAEMATFDQAGVSTKDSAQGV